MIDLERPSVLHCGHEVQRSARQARVAMGSYDHPGYGEGCLVDDRKAEVWYDHGFGRSVARSVEGLARANKAPFPLFGERWMLEARGYLCEAVGKGVVKVNATRTRPQPAGRRNHPLDNGPQETKLSLSVVLALN